MADNTKNRAINLHDTLFQQLEVLSDQDLSGEELEKELKRTKGICDVTDKIINLASLQLRAAEVKSENRLTSDEVPRLLS